MINGDPQRNLPAKWKRIFRGVLLTLCLAVTVWILIADPPQLEFWPTFAILTVIALGIAIPVGIDRKRERAKRNGHPLPESPDTHT